MATVAEIAPASLMKTILGRFLAQYLPQTDRRPGITIPCRGGRLLNTFQLQAASSIRPGIVVLRLAALSPDGELAAAANRRLGRESPR